MGEQVENLWCKIKPPEIPRRTKIIIGIFMVLSLVVAGVCIVKYLILKYEWLNVHLIPHSHDDVGWLKTPEDYYNTYVKHILDHVILELRRNPERKFVYVETYFFWKWWQEQTQQVKIIVENLLLNKQLEIIGGGWCMSDEAVVHYQSFIDQSTWGFRLLNDTFGPAICPTVAWQIDTFGHSKGIASMLAQMGFNSLFFARIDFNEKKYRRSHKQMEFVWVGNKNLGEASTIFTSIFYDHYSAPEGFDFENQPNLSKINYNKFASYARKQSRAYKTNNILVPMGDDFRFFNARKYFLKMDEVISFFQKNSEFKINVLYSTPSIYIENLMKSGETWPQKEGDFFPYASEPNAYWTGYFTSRPSLKYFERIGNNILQIFKQLLVFSHNGLKFFNELTSLREAVGVLQHHDAITGTAQQHVTDHYIEILSKAIDKSYSPIDVSLGQLSLLKGDFPRPIYKSCLLLNISECHITERASRFVVTVYNPLSRTVNSYVRIPVTRTKYSVQTSNGEEQEAQIVSIPRSVRNIPGRVSNAKTELVFRAVNIPAMGFRSYYVAEVETFPRRKNFQKIYSPKTLKLLFDRETQFLVGVKSNRSNLTLTQSLRYYKSAPERSGAYLFKPIKNNPVVLKAMETKLINNGELVKEYEQVFGDWASQIIRIYKDEDYLEFEWLIGPIPIQDFVGKEVILHYSSNINSGEEFFTDVNGLEMERRLKNFQIWNEKTFEKVAGNYYPVTSMISIKDDSNQMNVIIDRPQGGSSLKSGDIELMVHRRICYDDGKGVDEALNETAHGSGLVVRGRHWVLFGSTNFQLDQKAKLFSQQRHSEPWLFFFDAETLSFEDWSSSYLAEFSGLQIYVPRNIRILTLEPWRKDEVLLRLEHLFEKLPKHQLNNAPVLINLKNLFTNFDILEAKETSLGADRWKCDIERLKWQVESNKIPKAEEKEFSVHKDYWTVSLKPQEIRTFVLKIKHKDS